MKRPMTIAAAQLGPNQLVIARIDLEDVASTRAKLPLTRDRRSDLYGDLLAL